MSTITPQSSGAPRARSVHSSNGKENQANSRPNSDSAAKMAKRAEARNASRLHKPLSAQTIFEQKSAEGKELGSLGDGGVKRLSDAMDEEAEPPEPLTSCPIALALRGTDRDYTNVEAVLDTKLPGKKPTGIKELNERLEAQKLVVMQLRSVGKTLLSRCQETEKVAASITSQHEAAVAKVEAERDEVKAERDAANAKIASLTEEKTATETRLNSALASFAAVDEQRRVGLEERDAARAQAALKAAAEESCRKELEQRSQDLAASKTEAEGLRATMETRQMVTDKEMNELREHLGKEMVAAREANSKLTNATSELTELRTKFAVAEEALKVAKSENERLEAERSGKVQDLQAMEGEKAALGMRLDDMQRRLDEREAQHSDAMKSLVRALNPKP
jgi:hypothetical protein